MEARLGSRFVPAIDFGHDFLNGCTFEPSVTVTRVVSSSGSIQAECCLHAVEHYFEPVSAGGGAPVSVSVLPSAETV